MNRYVVSFYSEFEGKLKQSRIEANDKREAALAFLEQDNQKDWVEVLKDTNEYPDFNSIKNQLIQWDCDIAVIKL